MTTAHDIDLPTVLAERLTSCHPDVLRELLATFIHNLMGAEADALCGAGYGERSATRTNQRNGYRNRQFDTRAGTLDLAIPKLRHGSYFPEWLLERRKRAERALTTVVATCYLLGVSTRRMDKLVDSLGITSLSKSQVSVMAKELDTAVEAFRTRPLDAGPYTFVAADALVLKVRPVGNACHLNRISCFGDEDAPGLGRIARLEATIAVRAAADPSESWTARLLSEGPKRAAQKVGEEGVETALAGAAGPDTELASEAADLVYHLLVLLRARNMVFQDVLDVLAQRAEAARQTEGPPGT